MVFGKRLLSLTAVLAFGALSVFASSPQASAGKASPAATKSKAQPKAKDHIVQGSVVTVEDNVMTVRAGRKDMVFKLDSSTQKPASIGAGTEVAVTYRDEGKQHVASSIELSAAKGLGAKSPSHK